MLITPPPPTGILKTNPAHTQSRSYSQVRLSTSDSTSVASSEDDEDDAPLASLISPRRPGSDISHASSRVKVHKPLIDISTLTSTPPPPPPSENNDGRPSKFLSPSNSLSSPTSDMINRKEIPMRRSTRSPPVKQQSGDSVSTLGERLARVVHSVGSGKKDGDANPSTDGNATRVLKLGHHRRTSSDQSHVMTRDLQNLGVSGGAEEIKPESGKAEEDRIVPTPIRQRVPPSSFSVTSRPQHPSPPGSASIVSSSNPPAQPRQRSTTLVPASTTSSSLNASPPPPMPSPREREQANVSAPRPRSSTLSSVGGTSGLMPVFPVPTKPFAASPGRRGSPASSTEDSSSGRVPLTPRDGSDVGPARASHTREGSGEWGSGVSGLGAGKGKERVGQQKRPSVNFEDNTERVKGRRVNEPESTETSEIRRRERRRIEAKAAIDVCGSTYFPPRVLTYIYSWDSLRTI
jgi:hypothetical protein